TIFEPNVLRVFLLAEHRHRQLIGGPEHLDFADVDFDGARGQVRILGAGGGASPPSPAAPPPLPTPPLRGPVPPPGRGRPPHLGDAVMIAQVDEQHSAVVADAVAPARKPHLLADVICAQGAAGMGAVAVHGDDLTLDAARKGTCAGSLVKNGKAMVAPALDPPIPPRRGPWSRKPPMRSRLPRALLALGPRDGGEPQDADSQR